MTRTTLLALGALTLAACGQQAQQAEAPPPATVSTPQVAVMSNAEFVQAVANASAFEIQSSELAPRNASRQEVKDVAAALVRDHTAASTQLAGLLPQLGIAAPTAALNADQTADISALRALNGAAFDDAYLDDQVEAHNETVRLFETYVQGAEAGQLRDWAQQTLATLRTHQQRVQTLEDAT